jgi:hypothetical protein
MFEHLSELPKPSDDTTAALLPPVAPPTFEGLLDELGRGHPELAWMTQLLAMQRQRTSSDTPAPDDTLRAQLDAVTDELTRARARTAKLEDVARRLATDLRSAQARLSDLASAFGACGLCWGEDRDCRGCRGRGKPGRFAPDPELRARMFSESLDVAAASRLSTHPDPQQGDEPWVSIPTN